MQRAWRPVRAWGQHTCQAQRLHQRQTRTWAHRRFVAQVCAVRVSGQCTPVCPSRLQAHTSLMETPGLQSNAWLPEEPRPERAHRRLAPSQGTRQTRKSQGLT